MSVKQSLNCNVLLYDAISISLLDNNTLDPDCNIFTFVTCTKYVAFMKVFNAPVSTIAYVVLVLSKSFLSYTDKTLLVSKRVNITFKSCFILFSLRHNLKVLFLCLFTITHICFAFLRCISEPPIRSWNVTLLLCPPALILQYVPVFVHVPCVQQYFQGLVPFVMNWFFFIHSIRLLSSWSSFCEIVVKILTWL